MAPELPSVPTGLRSLTGTLLGYALLGLGIAMVGVTGFELLLASGDPRAGTPLGLPQVALGLLLGSVGYLLLSRVAGSEEGDEESTAQSAHMYMFDT